MRTTKLDIYFREYIHKRDAQDSAIICPTCGIMKFVSEFECGHYVSRRFKSVKYDERNVHLQCKTCNRQVPTPKKIKDSWEKFLLDKFGSNIIHDLNEKKMLMFRKSDLPVLENIYKNKVREL